MKNLATLGLIALMLTPAYAVEMEDQKAANSDDYQVMVSDHGTIEQETAKGREAEAAAMEATEDAPTSSERVLIIASSKEHVAILSDRLTDREPSAADATRVVKVLASNAKPAAIIEALSQGENGGFQAVVLDGDFAKEATVSDKMDELRARGIFARAIGTIIPRE